MQKLETSKKQSIGRRIIASFVLAAFLLNSGIAPVRYVYAQEMLQLPQPGTRINLSPTFAPPLLKGVKVYPDNPFKLDFILDKGDSSASTEDLKAESTRLIKYFLASITVPEKDLWVNLSPYEKDRIIPDGFGVTEMGRDLLAQDYMLKQITASVVYPEEKIGKEFWDKVYTEAQRRFGSTDVPVDTFNKVWIVPEKAVVYENTDSAYVVESRLKVLLEEDYLALEKGTVDPKGLSNVTETNKLGAEIVREVVIPILEKEVNEGKSFAQLRQVYHSLILALWFKDKIRESILGQAYVDKDKVAGVDIADKAAKEKIWAQYVEAFKKGAYNYIKEEYDSVSQQMVPRKYFSGGAGLYRTRSVLFKSHDNSRLPQGISDRAMVVESNFALVENAAMPDHAESGVVVAQGRLSEDSPEERFRNKYHEAFPNREELYEENPVHRQGHYRRVYDAVAGIFGIDLADDNKRLSEGKRLLDLLDRQGDESLIADAVSHLKAYTYVASGAHRVTPIALAIKNHFLGKNIFSPDAVDGLVALDPEFSWLRTTHPFYAESGTYEMGPVGTLPKLVLPLPASKKKYRTLDVGAAPKDKGSTTQNLMRHFFDGDGDMKEREFEVMATDIFFPIFEEKDGRIHRRADADLPEKTINRVHYYDALRFAPKGVHAADVTSDDFNRNGELGHFDYITMTATFHHLAKTNGEIFANLPLADVKLQHPDGTVFDDRYFMARTQQKVLTNLLYALEDGGVFFLNLTLSKTPETQYAMSKEEAEMHMAQHFRDMSNGDNYIVIRRDKDHFTIYDQVISYRPSGEKEGTEDSLLRGEVGFYTKIKISDTYPGVALDDENYQKIRRILRQADMQVFWYQGVNKSRWGRVMASAQAIERGASFPEWLEVYMANVPENEMKTRIIEAAKELHQTLVALPPVQLDRTNVVSDSAGGTPNANRIDVEGFDGLFKVDPQTGRIYYGDRSKAVKLSVPVYAVRHGQSVAQTLRGTRQPGYWSEEEIDKLSEQGIEQARKLAPDLFDKLSSEGVFDGDFIVLTSKLIRAQQTAKPFLDLTQQRLRKSFPIEQTALINELDNSLRGFSVDFLTPEVIRVRDEVYSLNAMAKLPKGESFIDLLSRAQKFVFYANEHYKGKKIVLFSHSLFMNALRMVQGDGDWEDQDGFLDWNKNKADNTELWSFEPTGESSVLDKAQKSQEEKAESLGFKVIDQETGHITYGENFKPFDLTGVELVIVPHGLTDGDIEGVLQVSKDVDDPRFQLNAEGRRQVEQGAEVIWDQYGEKIKSGQVVFYRSGTRRTAQTAEAFIKYANSKAPGAVKDVRISDAIRMNLGAWEGTTKVQIDTVLPPDERSRARKFIKRNALIGPKDGQTYVDYLSDVRGFLNSIKNENNGKTVVVFGHGIFIKTVKVLLQTSDIIATPFLDWNSGGGSSYKLGMPLVMNDLPRKGQGAKNGISAWRKENTRGHSAEELSAYAANVRLEGLKIWRKMKGPLAGAMSPVDLYTVLLMDYVDREKFVSKHPQRLRIIPKGTAGNTFYSAAAYAGLVEPDRVSNIKKEDLEIVPTRFGLSEVSLYKMGTSLEQGIGLALASKIKQVDYPVMVFLTDGGLQLGIDHQAKFAAHMGLNNLTVVVDVNRLQNAYRVEDVDPTLALDANGHLSRLTALWEAYGWDVVEIDGHDFQQIHAAYDKIGQGQKPLVIFAKTTKGRGMTEIEGRLNFSHKFPSEDDYQQALKALQETADEYRANGHEIKYPEWTPVQRMAFDNQGFALPRSDLMIDEDLMQFERPLSDQGKLYLEKVLKSWLQEFIAANPNQVFVLNTDNPSPFELSTPIRSSTNQSPFIFAGINERFALNLAGGMFLEGLAPVYIGPAAHMPINAEDWKMLGLGKQNVLVVARSSGSALSYWGPGHLVYEDIELFKNPWCQVLQPAHAQDLTLILENYYRTYPRGKPTYLRMQEVNPFDLPAFLFDTEEKRRTIFHDGFYLADSYEGSTAPVVFVVSGKTVKEAVDAARELRKAGVSYKVINVLNLSSINNEKFGVLAKGASRIVTAIDALPQSLSSLVFDALPDQRSSVLSFGIRDGGSDAPESEIFSSNKIDSQSFIALAVKEGAIRETIMKSLNRLSDSEESRLIRESWEQALKDPDNSVMRNLIKVYLSAGREVGDRLIQAMVGLGEDVADPWAANYLISDLVSLFGAKLLGQNTEGLRAVVRDHEIKQVSLSSEGLSEEVVPVSKEMSISELRQAVRMFKSRQRASVLSANDYRAIAGGVQARNIRFMRQLLPILISKIWQEFGVSEKGSAILYFNDIKTAASDLDVVYVGPDQERVDRRLTELCNLLGIKRDLSAVILINQALKEGRGRNFFGYQYGGNIAAISINGGDFESFYQENLSLHNPDAARKMHEDRAREDLLKKWGNDVEQNQFRMENLKSVYGAAINDLLKSLVLKYELSYGVYDDEFWGKLGQHLDLEDLSFLRDTYELINEARSLAQYVTERRWDVADARVADIVDRLLNQQGVRDYRQVILHAKQRIDVLMGKYLKADPGVIADRYQGRADKNWDAIANLYDLIIKDRLGDAAQSDRAMKFQSTSSFDKGGIDLTRDKIGLQVQSSGSAVHFNFDPAMIQQLQNAAGLTPVIIDIRPMTTTVPTFLGLSEDRSLLQVASR